MSAKDYPVSFPYGATDPPYGTKQFPYHRGNDRACPTGTPVVIGSTTIGLTGATGMVTGAHLHIQEWQNTAYGDRKPQNEFKPGTVVDTGYNDQWGNYVTINVQGWNDTYCHLSRIDVTKGQVMGGDMPITVDQVARGIRGIGDREATQAELDNQTYRNDPGLFIDTFWNNGGKAGYESRAKWIGDIYRFMTDSDISQKDLDFYISRPFGYIDMIYSLGPDTNKKVKEANNGSASYIAAPQLFIKK